MTLNINIKLHEVLGNWLPTTKGSLYFQSEFAQEVHQAHHAQNTQLVGFCLFFLFIFYLGNQHTHAAESNAEPSKQQDPENTKSTPCFLWTHFQVKVQRQMSWSTQPFSLLQQRTTDALAYKPQIFIPDIRRGSGLNTPTVVYWALLLLVWLVVYSLWESPSWVLTWQKGQRASLKGLLKSFSFVLDPDDLITPTAPTWPWWPNHLHKHLFYHDDLIPITKNHRPQKDSHTQITCRILEATWKLQSNFGLT